MLFRAQRDFHLDLSRTTFIGDDERDGQAADAAGCPWIQVTDHCSVLDAARQLLSGDTTTKDHMRTTMNKEGSVP